MEIRNLPEIEFKIMIVKIIQDLRKRMEKMHEMFAKDLEELRNKQTEMNNTLEGINSRIAEAEEQINDLEDRMVEITATEQNIEKKNEKKRDNLRDLWDNIKHTKHSHYRGPRRRQEKRLEKIFKEIIVKNFLNMGKKLVNQVQEAQRVPGRINPRRNTLRHMVIKLTKIKDKDKTLKATREKQQIKRNSC